MPPRPDLSQLSSVDKDARIVVRWEGVEELEGRLGLNRTNSGKPPGSEGLKKPSRMNNQGEATGKKSGGQAGHGGTTLRQVETPDTVIDHYPPVCEGCGADVRGASVTGHQTRQVFDLPPPVVVVTAHRAHQGWGETCGSATRGSFPDAVTGPTQYGARVAALGGY